MSNKHIESLKIINFKCFKELEISNIGSVNLIGGKNNVGKTAFLEAVELFAPSNYGSDLFYPIFQILKRRQYEKLNQENNQYQSFEIDFMYDDKRETIISSTSKICKVKQSTTNFNIGRGKVSNILLTKNLILSVDDDTHDMGGIHYFNSATIFNGINDGVNDRNNLIYISTSKTKEQDIAVSFSALSELNLEHFLNNSLSLFDDNILELKPITKEHGVVLKLRLKNRESLVLLSSLGEGINRYIAILCAIWASKDSVLLIDEIENGIHYTNYKKLWQIIFQASVDANCQLFITTHSKECISAFNEVQLDNQYDVCNAQYFEFYRHLKKDLIVASNIDKERLHYSLTHEGRVRGE